MGTNLLGRNLAPIRQLSLFVLCFCFTAAYSQLALVNATVDGPTGAATSPFSWTTCTGTPDSQIISGTGPGIFGINTPPADGTSYCGFVSTATYEESIGQPLTITAGTSYSGSCELFRSILHSSWNGTGQLQIWGGTSCTNRNELLWSSGTIMNLNNWQTYPISFVPVQSHTYIVFVNFFNTGTGTGNYFCLDDIVLAPNAPTASADTTICPGDCATLWAAGDTMYQWSTITNPVPFSNLDTVVVCPTVTTDYIVAGSTATDTIRVTVLPPPPVVNLGPDSTVCDGDSVVLDAGNPGSAFLWTPTLDTTQTIAVYTSGIYQVTASNACGSDSDAVEIIVEPDPVVNLGNDTIFCFGGGITLDAGPGWAGYLWSTNATTQTINVSNSGTYHVTVSTAAGCVGMDTITVTVGQQLLVSASGTNPDCNGGSNGSVTATASGSPPLSYLWNAPGSPTTAVVNNLPAGTYTVYVQDAYGCSDSAMVTITEPGQLNTSITGTDETCPGRGDGTALVTASGGTPPYTYLWSNTETIPAIDSLVPGTYTVTVTDANGCTALNSISIGPGPGIVVTATGAPAFCEGEGGDTLFASAVGGVQPYYYTWWCSASVGLCGLDSINDNDPIANPSVSGWYYVQVTDGSGCQSNIDSIWVEVLPKPIVDAGPDIYLCGDSAPCQILTPTITGAPGPYTYEWIPSTGLNDPFIQNPCARPDTTTIYALVVTAGNGCSSDYTTTDTLATVTVHVNPVPIADAGPDIDICAGDSATLQGIGYGAGPAYLYQWSPTTGLSSSTGPNPRVSPPITTTYTLVAWSNNCPSYGDQVTVNVHTNPTVDAGADREICLGDSVMLDAQAGGDSTATGYTFTWWPSTGMADSTVEDPLVSPPSTTMYYVQAMSNFTCESPVDSVLVKVKPTPIADAGDNLTICFGNDVQLSGGYYYTTTDSANPSEIYYSWTPAANVSDPTIPDPVVTPLQNGWYYLDVYTNTCRTTDSVFITVIPEIGVSVSADTSITCSGDSVNLSAIAGIGGADFTWYPSTGLSNPLSANTAAAPDQTTTYIVIATEGGCADTAEITISVIPTPEAAYLSSQDIGCAPHLMSFMQTTEDGLFYIWDFGDGSPVSNEFQPNHLYENPGTYLVSLTAVGPGGCASTVQSVTVTVTEPALAEFSSDPNFPVELSLPNTGVSFQNESVNGVKYVWEFGDGSQSGEIDPSHVYSSPGSYMVTLTAIDEQGCASQVIHGPYVIFSPDLFIPNVFSPNDDDVNDIFLVEYTGSQPFQMEIFDRWGVMVSQSRNKNKGWNGKDLKGNDVIDGIYYYKVIVGDREFAGPVTLFR